MANVSVNVGRADAIMENIYSAHRGSGRELANPLGTYDNLSKDLSHDLGNDQVQDRRYNRP